MYHNVIYMKIFSFRCSFNSQSPMSNLRNIRCVSLKQRRELGVFCGYFLTIDRIANWSTGGNIASKTRSFMYISHCDTIRTPLLKWSQCSEYTKMRLCCMHNVARILSLCVQFCFWTAHHWVVESIGKARTQPGQWFHHRPCPLLFNPQLLETLLPLRALCPQGLLPWLISELNAPGVELSESLKGGALTPVSVTDTTPGVHQ